MDLMIPALIIAVFFAVLFGIGALLPLLRNRAILDHPNERSSHLAPTPKGGGLGVMAVVLPAWVAVGWSFGGGPFLAFLLPGCAFLLAAVSWLDDLRDLPPAVRFFVQVAAVACVLGLRPEEAGPVFQGLLPPLLDTAAAGLLWVWFINLFNFMDGIDGITGVETLVIGLGLGLLGGPAAAVLGLVMAGAALGFLKWNWHPARIFMGDVGSVPLGFLLGWLLLDTAAGGSWAAALILPAYYLADATTTLVRRAARGEKVWRAHREHAYQKAVQRGLSHSAVAGAVGALGVVLIGLAWLAANGQPLPALIAAALLNIGFLRFLSGGGRP